MRKSTSGFTIVELIIVVVVIGIIATIVIVSYNGIQKSTLNQQRIAEFFGWKTTFEKYKAANGAYPAVADAGYCLGTDFPGGKCRDYKASSTNTYTEADSTTLAAALAPYDPPQQGPRVGVEAPNDSGTIGPYAIYTSNGNWVGIYTVIASGDPNDCPDSSVSAWNDTTGTRVLCRIILTD
jgi:prepilin-type N-terminal cleavage/methylation domain-containing protein